MHRYNVGIPVRNYTEYKLIFFHATFHRFECCRRCWELVQKEGLADIISVDCKDIFDIKIEQLRSYSFNYIASSASVNDLYYLRMMQVALELKIQHYIVNMVYLPIYKNLNVLDAVAGKRNTYTFTKFICKAYVAPAEGEKPVTERHLHCISTGEEVLQQKRGMSIEMKIFTTIHIC